MIKGLKSAENILIGTWSTPQGVGGTGLEIEYSIDGATNWHTAFQAGDFYMRQRLSGSANWSIAQRIIGENGSDGQDGAPGQDGVPGQDGLDGQDGNDGVDGQNGQDGADGQNGSDGAAGAIWHNGPGAPASSLGSNGDFYLDTFSGDVFVKASGSWSMQINLQGPTGQTGAAGPSGSSLSEYDIQQIAQAVYDGNQF